MSECGDLARLGLDDLSEDSTDLTTYSIVAVLRLIRYTSYSIVTVIMFIRYTPYSIVAVLRLIRCTTYAVVAL